MLRSRLTPTPIQRQVELYNVTYCEYKINYDTSHCRRLTITHDNMSE